MITSDAFLLMPEAVRLMLLKIEQRLKEFVISVEEGASLGGCSALADGLVADIQEVVDGYKTTCTAVQRRQA